MQQTQVLKPRLSDFGIVYYPNYKKMYSFGLVSLSQKIIAWKPF